MKEGEGGRERWKKGEGRREDEGEREGGEGRGKLGE